VELCYGVGRIGSVVGPVIAGIIVGASFSIPTLFYFSGALMLIGMIAGTLLVPLYNQQSNDTRAAT
jgi:MFS family permease